MRTCGCEDTDNRRLILALADLCLCVVVRQTVVVGGGDGGGLADGTVHLGKADDMLLLLVVGVHEDGMLRAVLRVEFEELGDGESSVDAGAGESRAVGSLYGLHSGVVESERAFERHRKEIGEWSRIGGDDGQSACPGTSIYALARTAPKM